MRLFITVVLFCAFSSAASCRKQQTQQSPPTPTVVNAGHPPIVPWKPLRPDWLQNLPEEAPDEVRQQFGLLTDGLIQATATYGAQGVDRHRSHSRAQTTVPPELREAALYVAAHLPENIRWRDDLRNGALAIANGRVRIVQPRDIEPTSELVQPTNPFVQVDELNGWLVHMDFGSTPLEQRASLVYALAVHAHLHDLARIAGVTPQTFELTLRTCENLSSEFRTVTRLQALRAMATWIQVDPDFGPVNTFTRLNGRYQTSLAFSAIYGDVDILLSNAYTPPEQELALMRATMLYMAIHYPAAGNRLCSRYAITRGHYYGHYLVFSDNVPEVVPILNRVPEATSNEPSPEGTRP